MNHSLRKRQLQEGTIDVAGERRQRRIGLHAVPVHTGYGCRMSATETVSPRARCGHSGIPAFTTMRVSNDQNHGINCVIHIVVRLEFILRNSLRQFIHNVAVDKGRTSLGQYMCLCPSGSQSSGDQTCTTLSLECIITLIPRFPPRTWRRRGSHRGLHVNKISQVCAPA